jgi:hypothetical protein
MPARFVTNRQRNISSVGDIVTILELVQYIEDRCKDVLFVRMYKIANEKVDIT